MQLAGKRLRVIKLLLFAQFVSIFVVGGAGWLIGGPLSGKSALLGGLICWLPSTYFAFRAFRHRGARAAQKILRSFYAGEVGKMFLTMAMFTIVFVKVEPLDALALFIGFALVQTLNWLVPLLVARADSNGITQ